ncbi:hypothetical protein [Streptomyces odonnellii]|uniref:hypothetical protein n=1 Tax=Streptomyces odonnellii TaxID=1417980 RepID=UPI000625B8B8|nr:hypothetical protein [Streptomyces odonnellii]
MAAERTTRRTATKTTPAPPVEPDKCATCKGSGLVAVTVRVGRRHRNVGQQEGFCLACFGSGDASSD